MDDTKIRAFPNEASRKTVRELLDDVERPTEAVAVTGRARNKLGLYPLAEDVIISLPLYYLIVKVLTEGTPADQEKVAEMMRLAYDAPFPLQ
jgi:hypothetical protein